MTTNKLQSKVQDLESRLKILEAENDRLTEKAEETLLLGLVAENINTNILPEAILGNTLEQISLLKGIPYSVFCEILDEEVLILSWYSDFREDRPYTDHIKISPTAIPTPEKGARIFSEAELQAKDILIQLEGSNFTPSRILCVPFSSHLIRQGVLLLADNAPEDKFSASVEFLERLLKIVVNRLDNLSLVQELQHINTALNLEVDRRVSELRKTNEELRKTMLQRLSVEEALLRQRDLVTNISEASPVGITIVDRYGQITYANARAEAILGVTKSQITGRKYNASEWKITDFQGHPLPENEMPFAIVQNTKQPAYNLRHAIEWPDGHRVLLVVNAAPLFDDEYRIDGMVAMIEDVTEQLEADAEFRRLQNFNASIVQSISEGIVVQDIHGYLTFVNPAAAKLLEFSPEELIGKKGQDIVAPEHHQTIENADARRAQGISDRYEVDLIARSGKRIHVLVSGSPRIDLHSGKFLGSLAVFTDITEQKYGENLRRTQRDLALQLSATTGVGNILHLCLDTSIQNTSMDAGGIYLVDQATGDLRLEHTLGLSQVFIDAGAFYEANSPHAKMITEGTPIYLHATDLEAVMTPTQINERIRALAILPIHHDGKVIACLNIASHTVDEISDADRNILEMIATQIGSAVSRAQAEDQLAQRVIQLKLINDIGEQIAAILDLESVLQRTAQLIQESFGYEHVGLFLMDSQKKAVSLRTISGDLVEIFQMGHTLKLGQGLVGTAALENQTILANNVDKDSRYVNLFPEVVHTHSELSVPIRIGNTVTGVIDAQSVKLKAFDDNDVMVMETLADQVAVAIHNANLHESVQKELSKRMQIESALRDSEEKFRNIVQSSPMGMHMYQLETDDRLIFVDANPAADLILGVDNQQFIGKPIEEAFPALSQTEVPQKYLLAAKEGLPWKTEQINYDENEITGTFEVYAFQTSPGKMVALFLEITERKHAEEALRNSENTLSSIFRAAPTGIGLVSERVLLRVNQRICEMTGYSQEELVGQNARILYPSDSDYEYVGKEKYRQIQKYGTGTVETRWKHKNGQIIHVLMSSTPIDPDNLVAGVTFTALDITERKQAEEALRRSENTLSSIFRVAPTGIGLISEQIFQQVNLRICEMTGYEQHELVGQHIQIIFPSQQHFIFYEKDIYRQIKNNGSGTIETRWQQKDGETIDVLLSATPVDSQDWSAGITITVLDITERKQNEASIQRQLRRLAALNQVDAAITGNLDLDRVINILLEQATRQLNVSAAAVLLYKPPTQTLEFYSGYGFYTDSIKKTKLRLGQDFAGKAALERRIIKAAEPDPFLLNRPPFSVEGFQCYFGVPLIARGQIKGVLEVFNHEILAPSPGWLSFLETIAGQAAIAIDNAEMVDNLERSNLELRLAYNNTLEGWAKALELRDFETEGHSRRVTELTIQVAQGVGIPNEQLVHVQRGALLHDIGKMGIADHILLKNGPLNEDEWVIMRQHPIYAYEMLKTIDFLKLAMDIPRFHHEKWDGTGYPYGLKGAEIPLAARVFAIIDVWDALSNNRPYRPAWPQEKIMALIQTEKGKHFDPQVVEVFEKILKEQN